jgi:hypothetical protein
MGTRSVLELLLDKIIETKKAAARSAVTAADACVYAWFDECAALADVSPDEQDFDRLMRQDDHVLTTEQAHNLCDAYGLSILQELLDKLRETLRDGEQFGFPFPVQIYRSKENSKQFILTILNQES